MSDPISNAISLSQSRVQQVANLTQSSQAQSAIDTIERAKSAQLRALELRDQARAAQARAQELLDKYPLDKDPELIKRQLEAEILKKKAEAERLATNYRDMAIEEAKNRLAAIKLPTIPAFAIAVIIDPKSVQRMVVEKLKKEVAKLKNTAGKVNLKKGRELYSYPLRQLPKPPTLSIPSISIPTIPSTDALKIPKLPVPSLPKLPTISRENISGISSLPRLGR